MLSFAQARALFQGFQDALAAGVYTFSCADLARITVDTVRMYVACDGARYSMLADDEIKLGIMHGLSVTDDWAGLST